MGDGALSQDEIEALLQGANQAFGELESSGGSDITDAQKKNLIEVAKIITDNQSFSLSSISTKNATISFTGLTIGDSEALKKSLTGGGKYVESQAGYTGALQGNTYYYITEKDAVAISTLMMGQEETELTDMVAEVLNEAFSQMTGVSNSAITSKYASNFNNMPTDTHVVNDVSDINIDGKIAIVEAKMTIEDSIEDSPFIFAFDSNMINSIIAMTNPKSSPVANNQNTAGGGASSSGAPQVGIQHADFGNLSAAADVQGTGNIGLLMDVTMSLTVELGRATMTIRNILSLGEGSIIKLQKLAGEPVDLLVNGKLIAKGEVVVIDENFGVRVTDIINPMDRFGTKPF